MKEIVLTGLYTELDAADQVKNGFRSSLPVRTGKDLFAAPVECRVVILPETGVKLISSEREIVKSFLIEFLNANSGLKELKEKAQQILNSF